MANYQDNRVICSRETANKLITTGKDDYFSPIDFSKAMEVPPFSKYSYTVSYGSGCSIEDREDGMVDIGFESRNHTDLETIIDFITKYHEVEWWIQYEWVDIYHYYWCEGEVIEDIHRITEEEEELLSREWDEYFETDDIRRFAVLFTEREDQSQYVNFHPNKESKAYKEYVELVETTAERIANDIHTGERLPSLNKYDYHWKGLCRHYTTCLLMRTFYLYDMDIDESYIKMNIMSSDVLDAVQRRLFPYNQKLYAAIFGLAIGDALGVPYEFEERGSFECTDMTGYGSHNQPPGTWSDDTSMTLATLKSIKDNNGKVVVDDIRSNFLKWLNEGAFTANGEVFDVGHSTLKALMTGEPRMGDDENGNGSLMRILPLAFTDCTDDEIRAVSAITHGNRVSTEACVIYVHVARRLIAGEDIDDIVPSLKYDKPFHRLHKLHKLKEKDIKSSGYVVDTLEAALWALVHKKWLKGKTSYIMKWYEEDVLDAINLGDDTDTVGAVTGGLAALQYGLGFSTWDKWFSILRNKELILECLF